jgi:hypothetical protein
MLLACFVEMFGTLLAVLTQSVPDAMDHGGEPLPPFPK